MRRLTSTFSPGPLPFRQWVLPAPWPLPIPRRAGKPQLTTRPNRLTPTDVQTKVQQTWCLNALQNLVVPFDEDHRDQRPHLSLFDYVAKPRDVWSVVLCQLYPLPLKDDPEKESSMECHIQPSRDRSNRTRIDRSIAPAPKFSWGNPRTDQASQGDLSDHLVLQQEADRSNRPQPKHGGVTTAPPTRAEREALLTKVEVFSGDCILGTGSSRRTIGRCRQLPRRGRSLSGQTRSTIRPEGWIESLGGWRRSSPKTQS